MSKKTKQPKLISKYTIDEVIESLHNSITNCELKLDKCKSCQLYTRIIQLLEE